MAEPGEGPFDDPAFGEAFEALGARFTLHNLDLKGKVFRQFAQLFARIATIGPEPPQAREGHRQGGHQPTGDFAVLIVGFGHERLRIQHQAECIHDEVAFAPFDAFGCIVTTHPPLAVVFTDWLSMLAPLGVRSRLRLLRTRSRKLLFNVCHIPVLRRVLK